MLIPTETSARGPPAEMVDLERKDVNDSCPGQCGMIGLFLAQNVGGAVLPDVLRNLTGKKLFSGKNHDDGCTEIALRGGEKV